MPCYISFMDTYLRQAIAAILLLGSCMPTMAAAGNFPIRALDQDFRWQNGAAPAPQAQALRFGSPEKYVQLDIQQRIGQATASWQGLDLTGPAIQSAVAFSYRNEKAGFIGSAKVEQIYSPDLLSRQRQELRLGLDSLGWTNGEMSSMIYLIASRFSDMREGIKIYPGFQFMGSEFTTELDVDLSGDTMMYFKYRW
jgi:hypothetical protein